MAPTASTMQPASQQNRKIIRGKIERTIDRFERYPLLDVIWTQFARRLTHSLGALYGVPVEIQLAAKKIQRFRTCLDDVPHPALYCVFESREWQDRGLIIMDGGLAEANLEILLGGREDGLFEPETRAATHLDRALTRRLVDKMLAELARAFTAARADIGRVTLSSTRIETSPQFAAITREQTLVFSARLHIEFGDAGRCGQIDVLLPMPMLEPIRRYLIEVYRGEQKANDLVWTRHITSALMELPLAMDVELERVTVPFQQVARWKVGDILPLASGAATPLALQIPDCTGRTTLLTGSLGSIRGHKAIKLLTDQAANFTAPLGNLATQLGIKPVAVAVPDSADGNADRQALASGTPVADDQAFPDL